MDADNATQYLADGIAGRTIHVKLGSTILGRSPLRLLFTAATAFVLLIVGNGCTNEVSSTPVAPPSPTLAESPTPSPTLKPASTPIPQATSTRTPTPKRTNVTVAPTPPKATATPTPSPTPTLSPTPTPEPLPTPAVGLVLPDIGLNIRDAPSVDDGNIQYTTQIGAELQLTGESSEVDGTLWVQLTDGNWVQAQYLDITGIAPAVPVVGVVLPEIGLNVRTAPSTEDGEVSYVAPSGEELVLTG